MKFSIIRQHSRQQKRFRFGRSSRCFWCGKRVIYRRKGRGRKVGVNAPDRASREHVLPRGLGGGGGRNVVAACRLCNMKRGRNTGWVPYHVQRRTGLFIPRHRQGEVS
jgi:hypothetical protein